MLEGSCHCAAVTWRFRGEPSTATSCNCTICRRYGVLWAYGLLGEDVQVAGPTTRYVRGDSIEFHFCPTCGCVVCWRSQDAGGNGRCRVAVNLRLAEPETVAAIAVRRFDGLENFTRLPADGRCVADLWF